MFDLVKLEFLRYKALLKRKEKLILSKEKAPPKVGDVRELLCFPPIYLALVEKKNSYFKAIPLTEEIVLGWLGRSTPVLKVKNVVLVALPFSILQRGYFLYNFSRKIGEIEQKEIFELIHYARKRDLPETIQKEYIELVKSRFNLFENNKKQKRFQMPLFNFKNTMKKFSYENMNIEKY
jgi:hypothetical protein